MASATGDACTFLAAADANVGQQNIRQQQRETAPQQEEALLNMKGAQVAMYAYEQQLEELQRQEDDMKELLQQLQANPTTAAGKVVQNITDALAAAQTAKKELLEAKTLLQPLIAQYDGVCAESRVVSTAEEAAASIGSACIGVSSNDKEEPGRWRGGEGSALLEGTAEQQQNPASEASLSASSMSCSEEEDTCASHDETSRIRSNHDQSITGSSGSNSSGSKNSGSNSSTNCRLERPHSGFNLCLFPVVKGEGKIDWRLGLARALLPSPALSETDDTAAAKEQGCVEREGNVAGRRCFKATAEEGVVQRAMTVEQQLRKQKQELLFCWHRSSLEQRSSARQRQQRLNSAAAGDAAAMGTEPLVALTGLCNANRNRNALVSASAAAAADSCTASSSEDATAIREQSHQRMLSQQEEQQQHEKQEHEKQKQQEQHQQQLHRKKKVVNNSGTRWLVLVLDLCPTAEQDIPCRSLIRFTMSSAAALNKTLLSFAVPPPSDDVGVSRFSRAGGHVDADAGAVGAAVEAAVAPEIARSTGLQVIGTATHFAAAVVHRAAAADCAGDRPPAGPGRVTTAIEEAAASGTAAVESGGAPAATAAAAAIRAVAAVDATTTGEAATGSKPTAHSEAAAAARKVTAGGAPSAADAGDFIKSVAAVEGACYSSCCRFSHGYLIPACDVCFVRWNSKEALKYLLQQQQQRPQVAREEQELTQQQHLHQQQQQYLQQDSHKAEETERQLQQHRRGSAVNPEQCSTRKTHVQNRGMQQGQRPETCASEDCRHRTDHNSSKACVSAETWISPPPSSSSASIRQSPSSCFRRHDEVMVRLPKARLWQRATLLQALRKRRRASLLLQQQQHPQHKQQQPQEQQQRQLPERTRKMECQQLHGQADEMGQQQNRRREAVVAKHVEDTAVGDSSDAAEWTLYARVRLQETDGKVEEIGERLRGQHSARPRRLALVRADQIYPCCASFSVGTQQVAAAAATAADAMTAAARIKGEEKTTAEAAGRDIPATEQRCQVLEQQQQERKENEGTNTSSENSSSDEEQEEHRERHDTCSSEMWKKLQHLSLLLGVDAEILQQRIFTTIKVSKRLKLKDATVTTSSSSLSPCSPSSSSVSPSSPSPGNKCRGAATNQGPEGGEAEECPLSSSRYFGCWMLHTSGIGLKIMQRSGYRPGECLGRTHRAKMLQIRQQETEEHLGGELQREGEQQQEGTRQQHLQQQHKQRQQQPQEEEQQQQQRQQHCPKRRRSLYSEGKEQEDSGEERETEESMPLGSSNTLKERAVKFPGRAEAVVDLEDAAAAAHEEAFLKAHNKERRDEAYDLSTVALVNPLGIRVLPPRLSLDYISDAASLQAAMKWDHYRRKAGGTAAAAAEERRGDAAIPGRKKRKGEAEGTWQYAEGSMIPSYCGEAGAAAAAAAAAVESDGAFALINGIYQQQRRVLLSTSKCDTGSSDKFVVDGISSNTGNISRLFPQEQQKTRLGSEGEAQKGSSDVSGLFLQGRRKTNTERYIATAAGDGKQQEQNSHSGLYSFDSDEDGDISYDSVEEQLRKEEKQQHEEELQQLRRQRKKGSSGLKILRQQLLEVQQQQRTIAKEVAAAAKHQQRHASSKASGTGGSGSNNANAFVFHYGTVAAAGQEQLHRLKERERVLLEVIRGNEKERIYKIF